MSLSIFGGRVAKRTYAAVGSTVGFDTSVDLDYDTNNPALNEPWMVRVRTGAGTLFKSFWLNESGLPRANAVRKNEPAFKAHSFGTDLTGAVIAVCDGWSTGAARRWAIDGKGRPLLGIDEIVGANVYVTTVGATLPANLPAGTVVIRT